MNTVYWRQCTIIFVCALFSTACTSTDQPIVGSNMGEPATKAQMLAQLSQPGPIVLTKHVSAHWEVPLSGMLNLEHPKALAAGLKDKQEPINIFTYTLEHPVEGTYLVDSGVSEHFNKSAAAAGVSWLVSIAMNMDRLAVKKTTKAIAKQFEEIRGVFLTHIHMDHIMGLRDLPDSTRVFIGPGNSHLKDILHVLTRGTTNRLLAHQGQLEEWQFSESGIIDVFADGTLFAIHAPGHTLGSTVYLARTVTGPELMIGDVTHTAWGWENGVEPGTYSSNIALSALSLAKLRDIVEANKSIRVHPGHQELD